MNSLIALPKWTLCSCSFDSGSVAVLCRIAPVSR